jgi:phage terminase large subunit-like protein
MEFLYHMTGQYPAWYPEDLRMQGPLKGRIVAKDLQKGVGEVITPFLDEWLDPSLVDRRIRNPIGIATKYILKNGSQFDILTHEMSTEQFEGWKGHVAWFDEPPPRDKYIATLRGLVDYSGSCWLTLTPLTQPWIYDEIYTRASAQDSDVFVVVCDITDNPFLSDAAVKQFASRLTEEEREARLHGRFLHLTGLVYKDFHPELHIIESPQLPNLKDCTRYFAIDPHERTPTACIWMAVDQKDNHFVYDELWLGDMTIEQIAQAILAQEGGMAPHVRLIDPHADKDNELASGFNIRKELMKYGVFCQRANSDPFLGKSRIREALRPVYSHVRGRNQSQFHIMRECSQTIYEFQHYIYDEYKRNKDELDPKEKVKKKNDHFMDGLRYIYNHGPRYIEPEGEVEEVHYSGEYAKHPVRVRRPASSGVAYNDLVER